jgi:hypothetical protein
MFFPQGARPSFTSKRNTHTHISTELRHNYMHHASTSVTLADNNYIPFRLETCHVKTVTMLRLFETVKRSNELTNIRMCSFASHSARQRNSDAWKCYNIWCVAYTQTDTDNTDKSSQWTRFIEHKLTFQYPVKSDSTGTNSSHHFTFLGVSVRIRSVPHTILNRSKVWAEWLASLLRTQEVSGSNLGPKTGYPDWGVS